MKKKDIKTKIKNAVHQAFAELEFAPSKKTNKSLTIFLKDFAVQVKNDRKRQLERERRLLTKEKKSKLKSA